DDLHNAVRNANTDVPAGEIDTLGGSRFRVRASDRLRSVDDIRAIPVGTFNNSPVLLADVAQVHLGHMKRTSLARYGGQDAVVVLARPKTDIDVLATANAIQQLVDHFDPGDPTVSIGTVRSQAREIGYMLEQLGGSALYGVILVVIILWVFM